jgi:hypothetical protein
MEPTTLQEAVCFFSDPGNCREWILSRRWSNGVTCPRCGGKSVKFLEKYNRWQCGARHASRQFTVKTGTIFEDSPLGIDKWLMAMWQVVNDRNGISSYEVSRMIGVSQKSTWFMDHRIRHALHRGQRLKPCSAATASSLKRTKRSSAERSRICTKPGRCVRRSQVRRAIKL